MKLNLTEKKLRHCKGHKGDPDHMVWFYQYDDVEEDTLMLKYRLKVSLHMMPEGQLCWFTFKVIVFVKGHNKNYQLNIRGYNTRYYVKDIGTMEALLKEYVNVYEIESGNRFFGFNNFIRGVKNPDTLGKVKKSLKEHRRGKDRITTCREVPKLVGTKYRLITNSEYERLRRMKSVKPKPVKSSGDILDR